MAAGPVVVIGAGVIGCAIARELAARGLPTIVLDDRPPGGGATQASAGMLAPYVEGHDGGALRELGVRSLDLYDSWIGSIAGESGIAIEYRRIGTLEVALDSERAAALRDEAARPSAVTRLWLSSDQARSSYPALGAVAGALSTPAHGYVDARQLVDALTRAAERRGATFRRTTVHAINRTGFDLTVTTSSEVLSASTVVLAAGAWTNRIDIGATAPPLRPVRGQLLHLGWRGDPIDSILWGPHCYIVPRLDGSLLVGATVEEVGFDERTTVEGIRSLLDAACELLPEATDATFLDARVGLRPATPDDLPAVGPDSAVEGLVHATGHYRNGVLLTPLTAVLVADWITKGTRDPALDLLRPERFR